MGFRLFSSGRRYATLTVCAPVHFLLAGIFLPLCPFFLALSVCLLFSFVFPSFRFSSPLDSPCFPLIVFVASLVSCLVFPRFHPLFVLVLLSGWLFFASHVFLFSGCWPYVSFPCVSLYFIVLLFPFPSFIFLFLL